VSLRSAEAAEHVSPPDGALASEAAALAERAEIEPTDVLAGTVALLALPTISQDTASVLWRARSVAVPR